MDVFLIGEFIDQLTGTSADASISMHDLIPSLTV
jgi:hypothetical protein